MSISKIVVSPRSIDVALRRPGPGTAFEGAEAAGDPSLKGVRAALADRTVSPAEGAERIALLSEALRVLGDGGPAPEVLFTAENEVASLIQSYLAEVAEARATVAGPVAGGFEAKFDEHDIFGWVGSFFTWWRRIKKHDWWPPPDQPEAMDNRLRIGVLGDWGTGMYGAPACAQSLQNDRNGFGLLLHLGDVYYSGTPREVEERFLTLWPRVAGAHSRAVNSNHEMYSGGYGYFDGTLPAFEQSSSCFAMQNDHWLLVGLDSAYEDHDLGMNQSAWVEGLVGAAGARKVVLFTHHQPYSLLEKQGVKLTGKLRSLLGQRRIFAWYWGHEHRCVIYDPHPFWGLHGRCIGHSGYPYYRDDPRNATVYDQGEGYRWLQLGPRDLVPGALLLDGPNPYVEGHEEKYGLQGYVTIELDGPHLLEAVHSPEGQVLYRNQLA